jgi:hypothetical protein
LFIRTPPSDPAMAAAIEAFAGEKNPKPHAGFLTVGGEPVFRTVYPSLAREQSCVDCHNKLQPQQHWQLNDLMGAFTIDVPGPSLWLCIGNASALGSACFSQWAASG